MRRRLFYDYTPWRTVDNAGAGLDGRPVLREHLHVLSLLLVTMRGDLGVMMWTALPDTPDVKARALRHARALQRNYRYGHAFVLGERQPTVPHQVVFRVYLFLPELVASMMDHHVLVDVMADVRSGP